MSGENQKQKDRKLHKEIVKQMLTLATSGFGLVAALAWNSLIQEFVNSYIKTYLPGNAGLLSLLIYAIIITAIAVFVTLQLSKVLRSLEADDDDDDQ
jgi:hypothetical protein